MASIDTVVQTTTKGYFTWNNLSNTLEFISSNASEDLKSKRKKKALNTDGPPKYGGMKVDSSPFNLPYSAGGLGGMTSVKGGPRTIVTQGGSPKFQLPMKYSTGETVQLMDVKRVALDNLLLAKQSIADTKQKHLRRDRKFDDEQMDETQTENISIHFKHLKDTPEFDHFLISLLQYFTCFFDQLEQELRPHKTSFLEPSKAELQALSETKKKMEITRRKLGQSYCVLILGLGIEKQHHMGCGKKRVSSTHRDKKMFEDLYLFCTYVVYVTFRYKEWDRVSIELGNMLRSEVFNPALQKKHKASVTAEVKKNNQENNKKEPVEIKTTAPGQKTERRKPVLKRCDDLLKVKLPQMEKLTPAQHRRKTGKRPAIRTAIYQRSTALVSLLPLPKEESEYLFQSKKEKLKKGTENDDVEFTMEDIASQKIGIIGEQMDLFNMNDLTPKTQENEDDIDSADDGEARDRDSLMQSNHNLGRQTDVISRVTTAEEK